MSDVGEGAERNTPATRDQFRVSHQDRDRVAEELRDAAGDGRITLEELDARLESAYSAKTFGDLVPLTSDLPGHAAEPARHQVTPRRIGGVPSWHNAIAILGGCERKGAWTVPTNFTAVAVMGGVELDLTEATFQTPEVTIGIYAMMGGAEVTVPDDVRVVVEGIGIMGGFSHPRGTDLPDDAPVLRIRGVALMGGVDVKLRPRRTPPQVDR